MTCSIGTWTIRSTMCSTVTCPMTIPREAQNESVLQIEMTTTKCVSTVRRLQCVDVGVRGREAENSDVFVVTVSLADCVGKGLRHWDLLPSGRECGLTELSDTDSRARDGAHRDLLHHLLVHVVRHLQSSTQSQKHTPL